MTIYTLNFYYLSYQSRHNQKHEKLRYENIQLNQDNALPVVTIQLPLFNEKYVARRLIDAVCKLDYPKHKLQIQVIDDSDDETVELIKKGLMNINGKALTLFTFVEIKIDLGIKLVL